MNSEATKITTEAIQWLKQDVFPLWIDHGIDSVNGGFFESLSFDGKPLQEDRRALVQARQIYAFTEAVKLDVITKEIAAPIVHDATKFLLKYYSNADGSFSHAVNASGVVTQPQAELYTQAFVLFALARAYNLLKLPELKVEGKKLISFLYSKRQHANQGFTEIKSGTILFQSNPHMHLFEAAIEWMKVDEDSDWKKLAAELYQLAKTKFIDAETGLLAEQFSAKWNPQCENGVFIFEPGHHYEWAWLMLQYQNLNDHATESIPLTLFELAEKYGVNHNTRLVFDEVYSDFKVKKESSRFWPQTERVKIAIQLGLRSKKTDQPKFSRIADEAMRAVFLYLQTPKRGLWFDTLQNGEFSSTPAKASSLYHFINAIAEYVQHRRLLQD